MDVVALADLCSLPLASLNELKPYLPANNEYKRYQLLKTMQRLKLTFATQITLLNQCVPTWQTDPTLLPLYLPEEALTQKTNLARMLMQTAKPSLNEFYQWSIDEPGDFWGVMNKTLAICWEQLPKETLDLSQGLETPVWFKEGKLNITQSCFNAPLDHIAIYYQTLAGNIETVTYQVLKRNMQQIANALLQHGIKPGTPIGLISAMDPLAIATYLAIIHVGATVVTIAESFSNTEIAERLQITNCHLVFTQDFIFANDKQQPLYEKMATLFEVNFIVRGQTGVAPDLKLRQQDMAWATFMAKAEANSVMVSVDPMATIHILFSSGTTATPKAIPWNHTTPIKAASDAFLHQDVTPKDILAWPTSLGWMMGPWLIFAALINQAALAISAHSPKTRQYGEFLAQTRVTMLGVVPTLVRAWRQSACMQGLDWSAIRLFSSSGECSNAEDMWYLSTLAGLKPIIEYCGGTEIGGAYISSTLLQANYPSLFSTPVMGSRWIILPDEGLSAEGEVALIPPCLGLSTQLLNADHHQIYFADMPTVEGIPLRRHGDRIHPLANGYYALEGRMDDTMNLGGIKISAAEIERALGGIAGINEVVAIGVTNQKTKLTQLIIICTTLEDLDKAKIKPIMDERIKQTLNPLFKISDIIFVRDLPRTATNKVMRRYLRDSYMDLN